MHKEKGIVALVPLIIIVGVMLVIASILHKDYKVSAQLGDNVRVITAPSGDCKSSTGCIYTLGVNCLGLAERQVKVKERQPAVSVRGGVLFTTGNWGKNPYSSQAPSTVTNLVQGGFQTFELYWTGTNGWGTGVLGVGFNKAMCAYAGAARWVHDNRMQEPSVMCATGNSGGGMQIAYGLSTYGLKDILDMAVIGGGPPTSDLEKGCFGSDPTYQDGTWPNPFGGRSLSDTIMGWPDYCLNPSTVTPLAISQAKDTSIVPGAPSTEMRDFNYPNTKVNFVEGGIDELRFNGKIYYNAITSSKSYQEILGVGHDVHKSIEGQSLIQQLILTQCQDPNATPTPTATPSASATPSPTPSPTSTPTPTPAGDTIPPTASITSPLDGATVSGTVAINVNATDNVGIAKVEFRIDGVLKVNDKVAPYSYSWNTTTYTNGSHAISVRAYDTSNNVSSNVTITVNVSN